MTCSYELSSDFLSVCGLLMCLLARCPSHWPSFSSMSATFTLSQLTETAIPPPVGLVSLKSTLERLNCQTYASKSEEVMLVAQIARHRCIRLTQSTLQATSIKHTHFSQPTRQPMRWLRGQNELEHDGCHCVAFLNNSVWFHVTALSEDEVVIRDSRWC